MKTKINRKFALLSAMTLAFAGNVAIAADPPKSQDTVSEQVADVRREAQIWTSYGLNPHLRAFDLSVNVDGNKAVLDGKVESRVAKDLAEQIALGVEGIKHVDNRIVIEPDYIPPKPASSDRSFGERVDDATITATVKSKLLWNSHTDGLDINVDTMNGKVILTGTANSASEKDLAGRLARRTNGVIGVNNQIAVAPGSPSSTDKAKTEVKDTAQKTGVVISDSWITTKVKSSLLFTRSINSFDIDVTTDKGVVSLSGKVDSSIERDLAIEVAQNVRGVKKVDASRLKVG